MSYVAAGVAVGSLASTAIGSAEASSQADKADQARQQAVQQWLAVNVPDPKQQQIELENYQVTGQLSPQLESAFQQSQTGLGNLQFNQAGQGAQEQALAKMGQIAQNGGMDAQAEQQIQGAIDQTNANAQGQRGAIVQNAMARGMGQGGGAMLAAELQAQQGDSNQAASSGMNAAAAAQMRALQAISQQASTGATLNSQDYAQAAAAAEAQDAINRFNAQNSQNVANANVTSANAAQAANLANDQSVANANTGVANQQETYNQGLKQQQFNDEATKAAGASGQYAGAAQQDNANAQNVGNMWGSLSQGLAQGAGAIAQYNNRPKSSSGVTSTGGVTGGSGNSDDYAAGGVVAPQHPNLTFEQALAIARAMKEATSAA